MIKTALRIQFQKWKPTFGSHYYYFSAMHPSLILFFSLKREEAFLLLLPPIIHLLQILYLKWGSLLQTTPLVIYATSAPINPISCKAHFISLIVYKAASS